MATTKKNTVARHITTFYLVSDKDNVRKCMAHIRSAPGWSQASLHDYKLSLDDLREIVRGAGFDYDSIEAKEPGTHPEQPWAIQVVMAGKLGAADFWVQQVVGELDKFVVIPYVTRDEIFKRRIPDGKVIGKRLRVNHGLMRERTGRR